MRGLSPARSTTAAPPHPRLRPASRLSTTPISWTDTGPGTDTGGSHVHCCPVDGLGTRLYPCGFATATAVDNSPWPPGPDPEYPARSSPPVMKRRVRTAIQPESTGLELARGSRGVTTPVPCVYLPVSLTAPGPSGSTGTDATLSRLLPSSPATPGLRLPPASPRRYDGRADGGLCTSIRNTSASWRTRAASSFTPPLRRRRDGGLSPPSEQHQRLVAQPAAFRPPAFASWAPCPARGFRPTYDRPTAQPALTRACRADPDEVSTFRTHETRTGPGVLYTPGTAVFAGRRPVRGRRLPPLSGQPLAPRYNDPARGVSVTRHQQGFPDSRPVPVLPLTCDRHGWNGGPWAFP